MIKTLRNFIILSSSGAVLALYLEHNAQPTYSSYTDHDIISHEEQAGPKQTRTPASLTAPVSLPEEVIESQTATSISASANQQASTSEQLNNSVVSGQQLQQATQKATRPDVPTNKRARTNSQSHGRDLNDQKNVSAEQNNPSEIVSSSYSNQNPQVSDTASAPAKPAGQSSSNNSNPIINNMSCAASMNEGSYPRPIDIRISCSEESIIRYCINVSNEQCDPFVSSIVYTGPIHLSASNSIYSISYFAQALNSSFTTQISSLVYTIDQSVPALAVNYVLTNAQTSQLPLLVQIQSSTFGSADYYYHQINLKTHDPSSSGLDWSCPEIATNYGTLHTPTAVATALNYPLQPLLVSDQIDQKIDGPELSTGDNYITTIIEDRVNGEFFCQTQKVTINDFPLHSFTGAGTTPLTSGVRRTLGNFVPYGHFQPTATSSKSGSLSSIKGTIKQLKGLLHNLF